MLWNEKKHWGTRVRPASFGVGKTRVLRLQCIVLQLKGVKCEKEAKGEKRRNGSETQQGSLKN